MTVFTAAYANKTLPLVRAIVADILAEGAALRGFVAVNGESSDSHDEYHRRNRTLNAYIEELEELGCIYADYSFSVGTVHFPALIDDREVFMNWQYGEDVIRYYHGVREQPSARREIPVELFNGFEADALEHAHSSNASASSEPDRRHDGRFHPRG